jgi:hypothetical protein
MEGFFHKNRSYGGKAILKTILFTLLFHGTALIKSPEKCAVRACARSFKERNDKINIPRHSLYSLIRDETPKNPIN